MKLEMLTCDKAGEYIMKYMDGDITEKEAGRLREHVEGCGSCKADFTMYDFILDELSKNLEMVSPPEDFTVTVMNRIAELPSPKRLAAAAVDKILYGVWGLFSVLFGLGFVVVMNREQVVEYMSSVPALSGYAEAITPVSQKVYDLFGQVISSVETVAVTASGFISDYKYLLFAVFIVLVGCQFFIARRGAAITDKNK